MGGVAESYSKCIFTFSKYCYALSVFIKDKQEKKVSLKYVFKYVNVEIY